MTIYVTQKPSYRLQGNKESPCCFDEGLGYIGFIKSLLDDYSQIYCVATKRDQAGIVIKEIKKMLDQAVPEVQERFDVYGKAQISKIMCKLTQSEIAPLSSDANT